jgi:hypothetical protein
MEKKLGEIDRARAIYIHCSQMCDPKNNQKFWTIWKDFEILHGNEDTVREMLRIKRSVQASYNVEFNFMTAQMMSSDPSKISINKLLFTSAIYIQLFSATLDNCPRVLFFARVFCRLL